MGGGPSGGSGGPLGQGGGFSVGDAFNYGWQKFQANVGSIVLGSLIYIGAALVLFILWFFIAGAIAGIGGDSNAGAIAFLMSMAVFGLAYFALQFVIQAGITRGGLAITYGRPLELQTFLSTDGLPQILLGSLILGLTAAVGTFLCLIPGLIVIFFTQFFPHFVLDKQMSAVEAMRASAQFVNRNLATMVALFIASTIALMIGYLLCFIGILAAFPVVVIAQTYAYRVLQGESVAA